MTTDLAPAPVDLKTSQIPGWKWGVVWLMFLATMINYMDRQTMTSTSSFVMREFKLNEEGYGWIEFWFGIAFATTQFPAGFLADRLNLRWLYAGALILWSAAGFATGLAHTFAALCACRLVLGVGESFNWPCAVTVVRRILPEEARSMANGIFHSGASIGAAITPLLVTWMIGADGENWRLVFEAVGAFGFLWAALWIFCIRGERAREVTHAAVTAPDADGKPAAPIPPFSHVFGLRVFWISLVVGITVNITWHFYRVWLLRMLVRDQGFSINASQYVQAGYYISADLGCMTAGFIIRHLIRSGISPVTARKWVCMGVSLLCLLSIPAVLTSNPWVSVPLIFIIAAGAMGGFTIFFTLAQEISAPHTAKCLGLIGGTVWFILAGFQPLVGWLRDHMSSFVPIVVVVGCIPMIGAVTLLLWPDKPAVERAELPA